MTARARGYVAGHVLELHYTEQGRVILTPALASAYLDAWLAGPAALREARIDVEHITLGVNRVPQEVAPRDRSLGRRRDG
jgi:hypothetical protein